MQDMYTAGAEDTSTVSAASPNHTLISSGRCVVCNCWQHVACAVAAGLVTDDEALHLATKHDYVCNMCAPVRPGEPNSLRHQIGLGVTDEHFIQARTVEQCHQRLIFFELPEHFTCQHQVCAAICVLIDESVGSGEAFVMARANPITTSSKVRLKFDVVS